jgi:hypothetical protein
MSFAINPVSKECREKEFKLRKPIIQSRNKPRSLIGIKTDPNIK